MNNIQVHAINGSMIAASNGPGRLLSIRTSAGDDTLLFVIAPACDGELELSNLLEAAKTHDERLWGMMESRTNAWTALVENLIAPAHRSTVLQEIKQGFAAVEDLLKAIWLVGDMSDGSSRFVDGIVGSWGATMLRESLESAGYPCRILPLQELLEDSIVSLVPGETVLITGELMQSQATSQDRDSEFTAASIGSRLDAQSITFWNAD